MKNSFDEKILNEAQDWLAVKQKGWNHEQTHRISFFFARPPLIKLKKMVAVDAFFIVV